MAATMKIGGATVLLGIVMTSANCWSEQQAMPVPSDVEVESELDAATQSPKRLHSEHLPNPVLVHPNVISGGLPEGDAAFRELAERGIKTIISVDGMKPDVSGAAKHGLRYVHLPHGYDGVPDHRVRELAKAVRDLPGPVYIHCHHGRHRSPAAASVACVGAGLLPPDAAIDVLKLAGTNPNYRGLFASAGAAEPITNEVLDAVDVKFRSTVEIPPIADAMVDLEHTFTNVKSIATAGWRSPENHPDLHPAHEVLLLREHFAELLRSDAVKGEPIDYRRLLIESESEAESLGTLLKKHRAGSLGAKVREAAESRLNRIAADCKACHVRFRDVPRSEKQ